jgi:hypothetical protein
MNKGISLVIMGLMVVSMLGVVSASTLITGQIYNSDYSDVVPGATVTVNCNGHEDVTTSMAPDGVYQVRFPSSECTFGDDLTVSATKDSLYGSKSGVIHDLDGVLGFDLGVVNVPLVPEFGLVAGAVTILSAVGIFFFVRRK